jgi:hypothetical protein
MMNLRLVLFMAAMLGAVGGCTDGGVGAIDYKLQGGFVGLQLNVHIDPSGEMTRVNERNGSSTTSTLDPTELADLHAKVDQARFPTLEPVYNCSCADDFVHTITVRIDGGTYTVVASSLAEYPERLDPLIDMLSSMTQPPETQN